MKPYCTHCRNNDHWTSECRELALSRYSPPNPRVVTRPVAPPPPKPRAKPWLVPKKATPPQPKLDGHSVTSAAAQGVPTAVELASAQPAPTDGTSPSKSSRLEHVADLTIGSPPTIQKGQGSDGTKSPASSGVTDPVPASAPVTKTDVSLTPPVNKDGDVNNKLTDRKVYMREYMRQRRAAQKPQK